MKTSMIFVLVFVFCLFEHTTAYCCFRDPWMLTPKCGCPDFDTPCGVVKCSNPSSCGCPNYEKSCQTCANKGNCGKTYTSSCGCGQTFAISPSCSSCSFGQCPSTSLCNCGLPACSNYRDTSNVCFVQDDPCPLRSCLRAADYDCGCQERSYIYFPEVEYPMVALEMKPFYYSGCYCY